MNEEDVIALRAAVATLEHPGLAARLGEIAGKPIELLGRASKTNNDACFIVKDNGGFAVAYVYYARAMRLGELRSPSCPTWLIAGPH
jgi:hypothetical protein